MSSEAVHITIKQMSLGVAAEKVRKIFCENAGKLYGFL